MYLLQGNALAGGVGIGSMAARNDAVDAKMSDLGLVIQEKKTGRC